MNIKRIIGIVSIIVGIVLLMVSRQIDQKLDEARDEIGGAKKKVSTGKKLFSLNPVSKEIGDGLAKGVDKKISDAEATVAHYEKVSMFCHVSGIVLVIVGAGIVFLSWKKKK